MTLAVLYGAKSTQDRHRSISTQLEDARDFAEEQDWSVVAEYTDDGFTAYSGNRGPGLRDAEERATRLAAEQGEPVMLVAQAADRFARGSGDAPEAADQLVEVWLRCRRQNVWLRTADDDSKMHSASDVARTGEEAHNEAKKIGRRVRRGMKRRREGEQHGDGLPRHTGGAVYGYHRDRDTPGKGLLPHELTGPVVLRIFTMAAANTSQNAIAETFNRELVATGFPKPLRASRWSQGSISALLRRRTYLGEIPADEPSQRNAPTIPDRWVKAAHDPLPGMSEELWQAAQSPVDRRTSRPGRGGGPRPNAGHLLTGYLLRHAPCGHAMTPRSNPPRKDGSIHGYYLCSGAKDGLCDRPAFRVEMRDVDDAILNYLAAVGIDADATLAALRTASDARSTGTQAELDAAKLESAGLEANYQRMWNYFTSGQIEPEDWTRFKAEHEEGKKASVARVARLQAQVDTLTSGPEAVVPMIADALELVRASVAAGQTDAVRGAIETLFEGFYVGELGELPEEAPVASRDALAARKKLRKMLAPVGDQADVEREAYLEEVELTGHLEYALEDPTEDGVSTAKGLVVLPIPREDALAAVVEEGKPVQVIGSDGRVIFRRVALPTTNNGGLTT